MFRNPLLRTWTLAIASVSVFTVFAGGDQIVRAVSRRGRPESADATAGTRAADGARRARGAGHPAGAAAVRQVITSAAKTDDGIFKVHRVGETLYYEIPKAQLGKDFLWNTQIKKTTIGAGYGGQSAGSRVVRWVTQGRPRAAAQHRLQRHGRLDRTRSPQAVDDANYPTIIRAFNVAAYSPAGDPVIDVTPLFMTDVPEFSVRGRIGGRGFDASRSFLEKAVSFPENINVEVTQTFTAGEHGGGGRRRRGAPARRAAGCADRAAPS